jgi:hypothetical protein
VASTIRRSAEAVNEMAILIWMRDAVALLRRTQNGKQNDFVGSIARRLHDLAAGNRA